VGRASARGPAQRDQARCCSRQRDERRSAALRRRRRQRRGLRRFLSSLVRAPGVRRGQMELTGATLSVFAMTRPPRRRAAARRRRLAARRVAGGGRGWAASTSPDRFRASRSVLVSRRCSRIRKMLGRASLPSAHLRHSRHSRLGARRSTAPRRNRAECREWGRRTRTVCPPGSVRATGTAPARSVKTAGAARPP